MKIPKGKPKLLRSIHNVLEFGKHKGSTIQQVMRDDPNWLHWALQNIKDFKLNHNALLLLPPQKVVIDGDRTGKTIEDGYGSYLNYNEDIKE